MDLSLTKTNIETESEENNSQNLLLNIENITPVIIDLYITIIKQIHKKGRKFILKYLVQPLRGNYERRFYDDLNYMVKSLDLHRKMKAWGRLSNVYKKLLQQTAYDPHPKDMLIIISRFLLDLEAYEAFRKTQIAKEFFMIFRESFYEFQEKNFSELKDSFEKALESSQESVSASTMGKSELTDIHKDRLNDEAEKLYQKIERFYIMKNKEKLTYYIAQYTGRFCNFHDVLHREDVDKIIEDLMTNNPEIRKEIKDRLSIKIFQEIVSAINKGDLRIAIRGISTFAITFQADMDVPYRKELDMLEEKLYAFIQKNNLWEKLKVQ